MAVAEAVIKAPKQNKKASKADNKMMNDALEKCERLKAAEEEAKKKETESKEENPEVRFCIVCPAVINVKSDSVYCRECHIRMKPDNELERRINALPPVDVLQYPSKAAAQAVVKQQHEQRRKLTRDECLHIHEQHHEIARIAAAAESTSDEVADREEEAETEMRVAESQARLFDPSSAEAPTSEEAAPTPIGYRYDEAEEYEAQYYRERAI